MKRNRVTIICSIVLIACFVLFSRSIKSNASVIPTMEITGHTGTVDFVYYWGKSTIHTTMVQDTATFNYDWKESDWEKVYREENNKLNKYKVSSIEYYNQLTQIYDALACWDYYLWNIEGCGINSKDSEWIKYDNDINLLYDPKLGDNYYQAKLKYLKAYESTNEKLYNYYIATSDYKEFMKDQKSLINKEDKFEIDKIKFLREYAEDQRTKIELW